MPTYLRFLRGRPHLRWWRQRKEEAYEALYDGHDDGTSIYSCESERDIEVLAVCLSSIRRNKQDFDFILVPGDAVTRSGFHVDQVQGGLGFQFADSRHRLIGDVLTASDARRLLASLYHEQQVEARRIEVHNLNILAQGPFTADELSPDEIGKLPEWMLGAR